MPNRSTPVTSFMRHVDVPPGESVTIEPRTIRYVTDERGFGLGYVVERGLGAQHPGGIDR